MSTPEIYELMGPGWKFPVHLQWHDTIAEVQFHPGVSLLKKQEKAIRDYLLRFEAEERDGSFWIPYHQAKQILAPTLCVDPEDIVVWTSTIEVREGKKSPDKFIEAYCNSDHAVIRQPFIAEMVWMSFCKFMLHVLINDQQPVDIFFAKLLPIQARGNWKDLALAYEKEHMTGKFKFDDQPEQIIQRGVADYLACERMVGVDTVDELSTWRMRSILANWTIECVPQSPWIETSRRMEAERRKIFRQNYLQIIYDQLKRQLPWAIEAYSYYLRQAAQPFTRFYRHEPHRVIGVENLQKCNTKWQIIESDVCCRRVAASEAKTEKQRAQKALGKKNASLSKMPNPAQSCVREGGDVVAESNNG